MDDWAIMFARCYETAGITNKDHIQITAGYGLWTAGIGFQAGCEKLGAMAIPMGPGNTDKQIQMMMDLKSTVLTATSSYALLLAEEINKRGIRDQLYLKKGIFGSERWSEKMREYIKRELGVSLYDIYGLTEIYGPGIGISCDENSGMHYWDDYVYIEIVDPKTLQPVPDGEEGEIVITTLVKEGAPLLRFRTHDISRIIPGECACGNKYPRLDIIKGRSDDMLIIRGVNVFPTQIESVILEMEEFEPHYLLIVGRENNTDTMELQVEVRPEFYSDEINKMLALKKKLGGRLQSVLGLGVNVKLVEPRSIERSVGKAKRVIDNRKM